MLISVGFSVCGFLLEGVSKLLLYTVSLSSSSIFASVPSWLAFSLAGGASRTFVSRVSPSSGICVSEMLACSKSVTPAVVIRSGVDWLAVGLDWGRIVSLNDVGVVRKGFEVRVACLLCCWRSACLVFKWMLIFL